MQMYSMVFVFICLVYILYDDNYLSFIPYNHDFNENRMGIICFSIS